MTIRRIAALVLASGILFVQTGAAQIMVIGQDRRASTSVLVVGGGESDFDQASEVAPDAGPFDVAFSTDAFIALASASAATEQHSEIAAQSITASGRITGSASADEGATAYSFSESNLAIRFTLGQPSYYTLQGTIESDGSSGSTLQLSRPFQTVAFYSADSGVLPLAQTGLLEADTYDINITCNGGANVAAPDGLVTSEAAYDILFLLSQSTDAPAIAESATALRAFPNPFRASTRLTVPDGVREVRVVDTSGRLVRTLTGSPAVVFDGRDDTGRPLAAGVYWMQPIGTTHVGAVKVVRLP